MHLSNLVLKLGLEHGERI
uniref:Uncharacterized protein n=1 Tax=Anguilla anguilla TaxID=7936 RepID=A0A0E9T8N2_ANGAN